MTFVNLAKHASRALILGAFLLLNTLQAQTTPSTAFGSNIDGAGSTGGDEAFTPAAAAAEKEKTEEKETEGESHTKPLPVKTLVQAPGQAVEDVRTRGPIVKEIKVDFVGYKSVGRSVILSNMRTAVGQPFTTAVAEEDIRNLYTTNLFNNIRIYDEPADSGVRVVVVVEAKPVVKQINVKGTSQIKEKAVRKEIKIKVGDTLSQSTVSENVRKVKEFYSKKGFFEVDVEDATEVDEKTGKGIVTFTVKEGRKAKVQKVILNGAKSVPQEEVLKLMKVRPENLFSFFNHSGLYSKDDLNEDIEKMKAYYGDRGYVDFEVKDTRLEFPKEGEMVVIIDIFEGIKYYVGNITIEGNTIFTKSQIEQRFSMKPGQVFSTSMLEKDTKALRDIYGEQGYLQTGINADQDANVATSKIDLSYIIKEGQQVFVDKIIIQGNSRTKDKVIRREMALAPGDVYDTVRAEASEKRLQNLGYFSKANIYPQDTDVQDRKNMVVKVEEQRTGSVTFGLGFSTVDSLLGFVEVTQGNFDIGNFPTFTGAGQKFRARLQLGLERKDALVSFTEPWFMDKRISVGGDLFYNESSYLSSIYDQRRYGASVRIAKPINQFWTWSAKYTAENIDIYDVDAGASTAIKEEEGSRTKSSVQTNFTYDTRDDLFLTRKGERLELLAEGAGGPILGDTNIWKLEAEVQKWWSLPWDLIFSTKAATGIVDKFGDSNRVPIFDRYFIGGSRSVRGFDFREVGPVDVNGEPIGGSTMAYTNFELTFPIMDRVRGAVFTDAGFDNAGVFDYSTTNYALGAGVGLRLNLPIGPLRLDLGFPVMANDNKSDGMQFHFDVGYQF
jgi:outer membrane protein insertion porin family